MDPNALESPETSDIDMAGWSDEDKLAYAAAKQQADDADQALAEDLAEVQGSAAQMAIATEKARAERAQLERKRLAREKIERAVVEKLRAQYGKKITFFQSKASLIAVKHPSMTSQFDLQARVDALPRKAEKMATVHDAVRELIEYPTKERIKELEKVYPMLLSEVNAKLESDMTAEDFAARPID
jgi:hypothetical protein